MRHSGLGALAVSIIVSVIAAVLVVPQGTADARPHTHQGTGATAEHHSAPPRQAVAIGHGGGVASVDPDATRIGLKVLRHGGNAVDAAIATAAALGVTEPYSSGLGGGGFFVYYDAKTHRVHTIDGRETAPAGITSDAFINPDTGQPYNFTPQLVTSGVSVGVPGSPATWQSALDQWGSMPLGKMLAPAERLADRGFVVDKTFREQTMENEERFNTFTTTPQLYLPDGHPPAVGSVLRNPDLAATYRMLGQQGMSAFYNGPLAAEIAATVQHPPVSGRTDLPVPPGSMTTADLAAYRAIDRKPTEVGYEGKKVFGMGPSSSGGTTVGEALNILATQHLHRLSTLQVLHRYLEAADLAFADRGEYVGDPAFTKVPVRDLLSKKYAAERACLIDPKRALALPLDPGDVSHYDGRCGTASKPLDHAYSQTEGPNTTNLTVTDRWGNVVEYTLTIEQTGGSGMVVPGRGFILNNELTDFTAVYDPKDPNRIQPGKRPRSSISPTIVTDAHNRPVLALGSPGGSTIITTVLQTLVNHFDLGMPIDKAIAAPRIAPNNSSPVLAEPAFIREWGARLAALGHDIKAVAPPGSLLAEIGAATAIQFGPGGELTVAAEPRRRGGGAAAVVTPIRGG
jgi:gamma-glutamyltranspeptidase/glutathione hydrolase